MHQKNIKNEICPERVRFCTDRPLKPNVGAGPGGGHFLTRLLPVFYPYFTRVPPCVWPMFTLRLACIRLQITGIRTGKGRPSCRQKTGLYLNDLISKRAKIAA